MPHVDKHAPGTFNWLELGTSDQSAAKRFYMSLLGWTFEDSPMGPNDFYTMFHLDGRNVAAAYTLRREQTAEGVPPHWNLYVAVESAAELGGSLLAGPLDVYSYGRMAVIRDPAGAVISVWEPKSHIGIGIQGQNASFCWADLNTADTEAAQRFYSGLFGWSFTPGQGGYLHVKSGDEFIGGMPPAEHHNPNVPPHWLIYIQVGDAASATSRALSLGAKVCMGPMFMENVGTISILTDPQNAAFALFEPARRG